jgi:vitamin B12 transporter
MPIHLFFYRNLLLPMLVAGMVCVAGSVAAQVKKDSLAGVTIRGKHIMTDDTRVNDFATGQKIAPIDSATLQQYRLQNVATLLAQQVPVFVKSYSFNGLATVSFRGASAAQSQVLWNGIPIQNAALGVADVSALPVSFMHKVNVVYGGSGSLLGSGNVGGALLLDSDKPVFDTGYRKLTVSGGAGSFGQYQGALNGAKSWKGWYMAANVFVQTARNNYRFTDETDSMRQMTNASLGSKAATLQAAYRINTANTVGLTVWMQQYDRQIPPALFEAASYKQQQDNSLRMVANWQCVQPKHTIYARSSIIRDNVAYQDQAIQLSTSNTVYQYYQEAGLKRRIGEWGQLLVFSPVQVSWIPGSSDTQMQKRAAIAAAYTTSLLRNKLRVSVQSRAEQINATSVFLPGAGVTLRITDWLRLRANAQRSYRMPTLNELYYFPGGNTSLKPEQGWSEDGGYTVSLKTERLTVYHDLSVFNRNIHDWILWLGGAIWTPHNIATVHSRGIETDNKITWQAGQWLLHASAGTSYILSTTESSYIQNDGSVGKQIPYAPRYNGRLNIGFTWRHIFFNYNHSYTGYRFITTDESAYLLPYQSGNFSVMYTLVINGRVFQLNAQYNNAWNAQYSVAGYRPMPMANWLLGLRLDLY